MAFGTDKPWKLFKEFVERPLLYGRISVWLIPCPMEMSGSTYDCRLAVPGAQLDLFWKCPVVTVNWQTSKMILFAKDSLKKYSCVWNDPSKGFQYSSSTSYWWVMQSKCSMLHYNLDYMFILMLYPRWSSFISIPFPNVVVGNCFSHSIGISVHSLCIHWALWSGDGH